MRHSDDMIDPISSSLLSNSPATSPISAPQAVAEKKAVEQVAMDFEAAFIAQMLTHSGLADALTSGEGKMASAFGSFFVEHLAEEMAQSGGIGMADIIYKQLERYEAGEG